MTRKMTQGAQRHGPPSPRATAALAAIKTERVAGAHVNLRSPEQILALQRSAGNRAVCASLRSGGRGPGAAGVPASSASAPAIQRTPAVTKPGLGGQVWAGKIEIKSRQRDEISKMFPDIDFDGWYLNPKKVSFLLDGKIENSEQGRGTSRGGVQVGREKDIGLRLEDKLKESKGSLLGVPAKIGVKGGFELLSGKAGVSATMYGQFAFVYAEGKVVAGVKYEQDKPPELIAGNLTLTGGGQLESKEMHLGEALFKVSGKATLSIELEPNWKKIGATLFEDVLPVAAEAAATAGPPLLFAAIVAMSIVEAGDKGDLYRGLAEYAVDARRAAALAHLVLSGVGDGLTAKGPISTAALSSAEGELQKAAAASQLAVPSLKELMRATSDKNAAVARERYLQCRNQALAALDQKASESVSAWRKGHGWSRFWTSFEDQMSEARKHYAPIMEAELSMRDVTNAPI